jgi:biopolymer transport protein ExbD
MLVLLILFMLVTPLGAARPRCIAARAASRRRRPQPVAPLVAVGLDSIEPQRAGGWAPWRSWRRSCGTCWPRAPIHTVLVRVDGPVTLRPAVEAMDVSRAAGADRIGLRQRAAPLISAPGARWRDA